MDIKGRGKIALIMCLLWMIGLAISYYLMSSEIFDYDTFRGDNVFWIVTIVSLLLLICGVCIFLKGWIRMFFPYIFLSDEDMLEYNVKKISFYLGILVMCFSCILLFPIRGIVMVVFMVIVAIAIEVGSIYTSVSDKFKADAQK